MTGRWFQTYSHFQAGKPPRLLHFPTAHDNLMAFGRPRRPVSDILSTREDSRMYPELYEALPDADAYLARLGLARADVPVSRAGLDRLVAAHVRAVPFEALDACPGGGVPTLGVREIYENITRRHRGGYCFQLNALFCLLLEALGFPARPVAVKVCRGREGPLPYTHRATLAEAEGALCYCDVGFGGPAPDFALPLDTAEAEARNGFFFRPAGDGFHALWWRGEPDGPVLMFRETAAEPADFVPLNYWCARSPDSPFSQRVLVNLRTADGSRAIDGNILRLHSRGVLTERSLAPGELSGALWDFFGIRYPG